MRYLVCLALVALCTSVCAQEAIVIKGLYMGMPQADFNREFPSGVDEMTVAGVRPKGRTGVMFRDRKLSFFTFPFDPSQYAQVKEAVVSKYPDLRCSTSVVQTRMGVKHDQEECVLRELTLSRYSDSVTTGTLTMVSKELEQQIEGEKKKGKSDI